MIKDSKLVLPSVSFLGDRLLNGSPYAIRPLSCLSVLSVTLHGVLCPNGWMDKDETWHAGRTRPRPHCVRWGPSFPHGKGPQFSFHVYCGLTVAHLSYCWALVTWKCIQYTFLWPAGRSTALAIARGLIYRLTWRKERSTVTPFSSKCCHLHLQERNINGKAKRRPGKIALRTSSLWLTSERRDLRRLSIASTHISETSR